MPKIFMNLLILYETWDRTR